MMFATLQAKHQEESLEEKKMSNNRVTTFRNLFFFFAQNINIFSALFNPLLRANPTFPSFSHSTIKKKRTTEERWWKEMSAKGTLRTLQKVNWLNRQEGSRQSSENIFLTLGNNFLLYLFIFLREVSERTVDSNLPISRHSLCMG